MIVKKIKLGKHYERSATIFYPATLGKPSAEKRELILGLGPNRGGGFQPIPTSLTDFGAEIGQPLFSGGWDRGPRLTFFQVMVSLMPPIKLTG